MIIRVCEPFLPPISEYFQIASEIWDKKMLTNFGSLHQQFQSALADYLNVKYLTLTVNGHMALETIIKALKLEGEVITTPFTFASTTQAILNCGLKPVFCDIEDNTCNIDVKKIEQLITEKTSAIIPVHVYGNPCDVAEIERISKKFSLKVVYDAAHAFGVKVKDRSIFNYGDASICSLHATKLFHSIEGGFITYNQPELQSELRCLINFGLKDESAVMQGFNAKMNEFQAAMGIANIKYTDKIIKKRKDLSERYIEHLKGMEGIRYISHSTDVEYNYAYLPVIIDGDLFGMDRDALCEGLNKYDIYPRKYFYPLTSQSDFVKSLVKPSDTPVAKKITDNILCLPLYYDLDLDNVDFICDSIFVIRNGTRQSKIP